MMSIQMNRRSLLGGFAAAGTMAIASGTASAGAKKPFFARVGLPMGLQIYTLGGDVGRDVPGTFAAVAAAGYRAIELSNLFGKTPSEMGKMAAQAGLKITSFHLPHPSMAGGGISFASPATQIADTVGALGAKAAVMPICAFPASFRRAAGEDTQAALGRSFSSASPDHWKNTAEVLNKAAYALAPLGVEVGYHNHNVEFAPINNTTGGNTTGWQVLLDEIDPRLVKIQLDIGWVAAAGLDPVDFIRRHRGRLRWMHVKDVAASTKPNFALSMDPATVGTGKLDWARILPAAHEAGVRHFYVEQEPPFTTTRLEAAQQSAAFLKGLRA